MPKIRYLEGDTIAAGEGQTILSAAIAAKSRHMHECGGLGRCTTCRVQIVDGLSSLSLRSPEEEAIANRKGWSEEIRGGVFTATSQDGLTWTKHPEPCIELGDRWDSSMVSEPCVIGLDDGRSRLFYEACDSGENYRILSATSVSPRNGRSSFRSS